MSNFLIAQYEEVKHELVASHRKLADATAAHAMARAQAESQTMTYESEFNEHDTEKQKLKTQMQEREEGALRRSAHVLGVHVSLVAV